jgi:uncharacterized protein (DUF302 family)
MLDNPQSLAGIITKHSSKSVAQTVDRLTRVIADRGFTLFRVIDHSGTAERVGVQMPDSKLVMFGKPTVGAAVMLAARSRVWISRSRCWFGRTGRERSP